MSSTSEELGFDGDGDGVVEMVDGRDGDRCKERKLGWKRGLDGSDDESWKSRRSGQGKRPRQSEGRVKVGGLNERCERQEGRRAGVRVPAAAAAVCGRMDRTSRWHSWNSWHDQSGYSGRVAEWQSGCIECLPILHLNFTLPTQNQACRHLEIWLG